MNKSKIILKSISEIIIKLFANMFLWLLIFAGAVISLAESGNLFLAILLCLSGIAKVYQEHKKNVGDEE